MGVQSMQAAQRSPRTVIAVPVAEVDCYHRRSERVRLSHRACPREDLPRKRRHFAMKDLTCSQQDD